MPNSIMQSKTSFDSGVNETNNNIENSNEEAESNSYHSGGNNLNNFVIGSSAGVNR
jgi:hypothetical protein